MREQAVADSLARAIDALHLSDGHALVRSPDSVLTPADLRMFSGIGGARAQGGVALCLTDPLEMVRALLALDGHVPALLLLSPDLPVETVQALMRDAKVEKILSDRQDIPHAEAPDTLFADGAAHGARTDAHIETQWLLTTSGTTGMPKLVQHGRGSIFRAVRQPPTAEEARWAMLYDPSRFAGTQVLAQALLTGATLLTPRAGMKTAELVEWLCAEGCTHISATPSLWRRLLMAPATARLPLKQITLGGEIADDAILGALKARFADARLSHIYASTEAGTGFSVRDGKAGFPAEWLEDGAEVEGARLSLRDGLLWLRPPGEAHTQAPHIVRDAAGFIRTGDHMVIEDGRARFTGREDTTLNVGGVKVQVEAVEEIVHAHPAVAQCAITARPSAMMGSLLTLSVVPRADTEADPAMLKKDIALWCKERLPPPARPATIRIVAEIPVSAAGKTERTGQS